MNPDYPTPRLWQVWNLAAPSDAYGWRHGLSFTSGSLTAAVNEAVRRLNLTNGHYTLAVRAPDGDLRIESVDVVTQPAVSNSAIHRPLYA